MKVLSPQWFCMWRMFLFVPHLSFGARAEGLCFVIITKTCLFKYTENFTTNYENFQIQYSDSLHISA